MGYSVSTPIRDENTKIHMLHFLEKNLRKFTDLTDKIGPHDYYRGPLTSDLSYDHGPCRIGFDFNTAGYAREYIITICRWMALKVGKLHSFPTKIRPDLHGSIPIIVYDGDESTEPGDGDGPDPVILLGTMDLRLIAARNLQWVVNELGIPQKSNSHTWQRNIERAIYGFDGLEIIRAEMARLDALWRVD